MKILMIAPEPIFEPRGTPLSVVGRLKALSDIGHHVDLITYPIGQNVCFPGLRILRIPSIPGIRKVKVGPSLVKLPLDALLILKTFLQLSCKKYDLIHTHEEAGFWGVVASRVFHIPHIYDMHSSLPQQLQNFQFSKSQFLMEIFRMLERWVLKTASAVITICPDLQNHVIGIFPDKKSIMIENVVEYGTVFGEVDVSSEIRIRYALKNKRVILYAGTFEPYQGLDLLIQSARQVIQKQKNVIFLMVGGHPDQVIYYQHKVSRIGLKSFFVFTGQVLPQEVPSYIRCANVLVSPRKSGTNTPLKLYSYLRSGVPIVATHLWTHTQVLSEDVSVLTAPTPEAFGEGILKILSNRQLVKKICTSAKKLADNKYSYSVYTKKITKTLQWALED